MKTVLGLSVTAHRIAWALVAGDGRSADVTPLDDDAFEVEAADQLADRAAAAARSAQAIAASSGQDVAAIGVTWPGPGADDSGDNLAQLLDLLAVAGFDDVRVVAEDADTAGSDVDGAQVPAARVAAQAVATNAVAPALKPARHRPPTPRKHRAVRAVAAAAATVAAGLLTVGSQFVEPVPTPAADDGDITAAAAPQLVTVATPRQAARSVTTLPAEEPVSMHVAQRAERAERAPIAQPAEPSVPAPVVSTEPVQSVAPVQHVALVEPTAPQVIPIAGAPVPHLPAAVTAPIVGPPAPEPHLAADPAPGPAPAPGLWLPGAMP